MKTLFTSIFLFISFALFSQSEIILQPNASEGKDARIQSNIPDTNIGGTQLFSAQSGTISGETFIDRSLIDFDIASAIPANSEIISAELSLFANTVNGGHTQLDGSNASVLELITESWDEELVTWSNQPATDNGVAVTLQESLSFDEDYMNIDVTLLINEMYLNPTESFGFMIKLAEETERRSIQFGSSDAPDEDISPRLRIVYEELGCVELLSTNMDCRIQSNLPDQNIGGTQLYSAQAGTMSGEAFIDRSLINFDLSQIPDGAEILSASINLYANTVNGGHTTTDGSNESMLVMITEEWEEETTTWNNQPAVDENFSVSLSESLNSDQDYIDIDVSELIEHMINNPDSGFGLMIKLADETGRRSMQFASSNAADANLHPTLKICYEIPLSSKDISTSSDELNIYPNPTTGHFSIEMETETKSQAIVYNQSGQIVDKFMLLSKVTERNFEALQSGVYYISMLNEDNSTTKKLIKL